MKPIRLMLTVLLYFSGAVFGTTLTVIYDSGDTLPIRPYLKLQPRPPTSNKPPHTPARAIRYPVTTPSMQPGKVTARALHIPHLQTPLFIIGNDERSRQWLRKRAALLKQLGAVGLLVEVQTEQGTTTIRKLAEGLRIAVASAEDIARQLQLRHYPVLISKQGIEQ